MSQPGNSPQLSVSESLLYLKKSIFTDLCARGLKQIIVCCTPHFKKVQSCIINCKIIMFCMSLLLQLLELHGCLLGFIHSMIVRPLCLLMRFTRRGTREGNCSLHTTRSIREMLPRVIAYNRNNYARHMSVYWCEMVLLPQTHPYSNALLVDGQFAVQRIRTSSC